MKIYIFFALFFIWGCQSNETEQKSKDSEIVNFANEKLTTLELKNTVVDVGSISDDTTVFADYYLQNTGSEDLHIYSVAPDCYCTGYKLSKKVVSSGDTAKIVLEFNSKNKYGKQKIYSTVTVNTKDKLYRLILKANIK